MAEIPLGKIMNPVSHASDSTPSSFVEDVRGIRRRLLALREAALAIERVGEDEIALAHPDRESRPRNLVDYLALRQQDLRDPQYARLSSDCRRSASFIGT